MKTDQGASPPEGRQDGGVAVTDAMVEAVAAKFMANQHGVDLLGYPDGTYKSGILYSMRVALEAALTHSTPVEAPTREDIARIMQPAIREGLAHILVAGASDVQRAAAVEALEEDEDAKEILDGGSGMIAEFAAEALLAAQPLPKQGTGEGPKVTGWMSGDDFISNYYGDDEPDAATETMQPDTYTGGNFNGVTEGGR